MDDTFKVLTTKEEQKLTNEELLNYYKELRDWLMQIPSSNFTKGSLTICPKINKLLRCILPKICKYDIIVEGRSNVENLVGIYAHTHQSKWDHVNMIVSNPNHTILLNSIVLSNPYKILLSTNGVVYVDKFDKDSKNNAKLELMRLLLQGKSITMFPESAWNCSPNKLHLPLYIGMIDMAKKTRRPIIPVVQEYIYDNTKLDGIERVNKVYVKYGNPIYVEETDDSIEKLSEYSTQISTMRWDLISRKGTYCRKDIYAEEYINFFKGCIRNLKNAGIDIEVENKGIYGAQDDFYLFHHINALDYDEHNNFLPTSHVRKLIKLYNDNCKN